MQGSRHVYAAGASGGGGFALTRRGFLALGRARSGAQPRLKRRTRASAATPESPGASLGRSFLCTLAPGQPRRSQRSARFSPSRVERQARARGKALPLRQGARDPSAASLADRKCRAGAQLAPSPPEPEAGNERGGSGRRKRRGDGPPAFPPPPLTAAGRDPPAPEAARLSFPFQEVRRSATLGAARFSFTSRIFTDGERTTTWPQTKSQLFILSSAWTQLLWHGCLLLLPVSLQGGTWLASSAVVQACTPRCPEFWNPERVRVLLKRCRL